MSVDPKSKKTYHQPFMGCGFPIIKYWAAQAISPSGSKLWQTLHHKSACLSCAWSNFGKVRSGAALMFYPEVNMIFQAHTDPKSGIPAYKRVPVWVYPLAV
jgi:hypothetical protein